MCTPLHPCPFYRSLSLPLRGLYIFPNQSWSTSPSPTSLRRMVFRDTPTPTVDVAYEQGCVIHVPTSIVANEYTAYPKNCSSLRNLSAKSSRLCGDEDTHTKSHSFSGLLYVSAVYWKRSMSIKASLHAQPSDLGYIHSGCSET